MTENIETATVEPLSEAQAAALMGDLIDKLTPIFEGQRNDVAVPALMAAVYGIVSLTPDPKGIVMFVIRSALGLADAVQMTDDEVIAIVMSHDAQTRPVVTAPAAPDSAHNAMAALIGAPAGEA